MDKKTRTLLWFIDSEFEAARYSLLKTSIYFEKLDKKYFERTTNEIKKNIENLGKLREMLVDYLNEQDFGFTNQAHEQMSKTAALS